MATVDAAAFYATYHGHEVAHLEQIYEPLRASSSLGMVFLAGDSSLDNKHWLFPQGQSKVDSDLPDGLAAPATPAYSAVLSPPRMVRDVAYWVNQLLLERLDNPENPDSLGMCCVNAAVEESTVADRFNGLMPQDEFIRDHLGPNDVVVVSVGGNDVALKPAPATQQHLANLMMADPAELKAHPSMGYLKKLFGEKVQQYIEKICSKCAPKMVVVCLCYYPCEQAGGSWADDTLDKLGYNVCPARLQGLMQLVFTEATKSIGHDPEDEYRPKLLGASVVHIALSEVLDSKDPDDYVQRVEPSIQGGRKMASAFTQCITDLLAAEIMAATMADPSSGGLL